MSSSRADARQLCSLPRAEPAAPLGSETTAKPLLLAQAPRTRSRCWCLPFILAQLPSCSSSFPSLHGRSPGSSPVVRWGDMGPDSKHVSAGGWTPQLPPLCTAPPNKAASNPTRPSSSQRPSRTHSSTSSTQPNGAWLGTYGTGQGLSAARDKAR